MSAVLKFDRFPDNSLHLWLGPLGFHLFLPDFWHSRFDWCAGWDEK